MHVRPDDLDMFRHVHASRYLDYVLAARYEQMARCYKMSMEEFLKLGLAWYQRVAHIEYKRPLGLGDHFIVRTRVEEFCKDGVKIGFEIVKQNTGKLCCDGWCHYTLVNLQTGRAETIPDWIVQKYSV
jgi:acyl-CoA thioester hydrolase/thioesterase-3